jgi:alpha-ribazole phosphatase
MLSATRSTFHHVTYSVSCRIPIRALQLMKYYSEDADSLEITLLRHGETTGGSGFRGSLDDPLSAKGWRQMAAAVQNGAWDAVISSPLVRCADFARLLARKRNLPLLLDARLREMHFGVWEGWTAAELMAENADGLGRFWQDPVSYAPLEAEPLPEVQARVLSAWEVLCHAAGPGRRLIVTHGGVIRVILCHILDMPLKNLLSLEVPHASLHRLLVTGKKIRRLAAGN